MVINHIAIWVKDLENMKDFYCKYFNGVSNAKYVNSNKVCSSYFIEFNIGGVRLELMHSVNVSEFNHSMHYGFCHLSFSLGSEQSVDSLTNQFRQNGFHIASEVRVTGDGYYESVILDPEGNLLELTI